MNEEIKQKKVIRDFYLTTWALKNTNTIFLLTVILVVFGIYSYKSLPKVAFSGYCDSNHYGSNPLSRKPAH